MIVRTAFVGAAAAGATLVGMALAPILIPDSAGSTRVIGAAVAPAAARPDATVAASGVEAIGAAQFAFRALHPPAPPAPEFAPEAAAPEPDVAAMFRADVTAVLLEKGRRVVVIVDPAAKNGRRTLRAGASYRDGWKVRAIEDGAVELRRRGEVRRVDLFAPIDSGDTETDTPFGAPFAVSGDTAPPRQRLMRDSASTSTQKE